MPDNRLFRLFPAFSGVYIQEKFFGPRRMRRAAKLASRLWSSAKFPGPVAHDYILRPEYGSFVPQADDVIGRRPCRQLLRSSVFAPGGGGRARARRCRAGPRE